MWIGYVFSCYNINKWIFSGLDSALARSPSSQATLASIGLQATSWTQSPPTPNNLSTLSASSAISTQIKCPIYTPQLPSSTTKKSKSPATIENNYRTQDSLLTEPSLIIKITNFLLNSKRIISMKTFLTKRSEPSSPLATSVLCVASISILPTLSTKEEP